MGIVPNDNIFQGQINMLCCENEDVNDFGVSFFFLMLIIGCMNMKFTTFQPPQIEVYFNLFCIIMSDCEALHL